MTRGEENREQEAVVGEQVLVEKEHTDVGTVPAGHHSNGCPRNLVHPLVNSRRVINGKTVFDFFFFFYEKRGFAIGEQWW